MDEKRIADRVARSFLAGTRWEVQEVDISGNWENNWHEGDEPWTFSSKSEAQRELKNYLEDVKDAVAKGDMAEEYDPDNFRIVPVEDSSKSISKFLDNAIDNLKRWADVEPGGEIQDTYLYRANAWFDDGVELMEKTGEDERKKEQYEVLKNMRWNTMPRSYNSVITFAGKKIEDSPERKGYAVDDSAAIAKFQRKIKRFIGEIKKLKRSFA